MTLNAKQTDAEILDEIAAVLDGREWDAETADVIAGLVRESGREVGDIPEWSGSLCPDAPAECWIDDATGEHVHATTGARSVACGIGGAR